MLKTFRKKNVLLRTGKKKKKATVSIHRAKHRWYRIMQESRRRHYEKTGELINI